MATIPQAIDYGARPSLRSDRLDLPGQGELATADAIVRAADNFSTIMIDRKVKQDSFNYNMAKQEYMTADLARREALKDDRDYETFDERYRTGLGEDRNEILTRRRLTPHDRAIFDAEADLIRERGAAGVQEFRRVIEIEHNLSDLEGSLATAREKALIAPPGESNEILLTALDQINAAEDNLWIPKDKATKKRQDLVQDVAFNKLRVMDAKEREEILEASLSYRKYKGGPISEDDIRKGMGTGYIADFLHTDTAKAMLEDTKKENELNNAKAEGYAAKDAAWEAHQGLDSTSMRKRAEIYRESGLTAEARSAAEAADARELLLQDRARTENWRQIDSELRRMIDDFDMSWSDLEGGLRSQLPPGMAAATEAYAKRVRTGDGYNDHVTSEASQAYAAMPREQRAEFDREGWMVHPPLREPKRWKDEITREQADFWETSAQQSRDAIAAGMVPETGITLTSRMDATFGQVMKKPGAGDDKELLDQWHRMELKYHNDAIKAGGQDKLTPEESQKILDDVVKFEVFERQTFMWIDNLNRDPQVFYATMSADQIQRGYLPLNHKVPPSGQTAHTMQVKFVESIDGVPDYGPAPAVEWLKAMGSANNPEGAGTMPDEEHLEEAFFYLVTQGPAAALNRLSGVEGF